eukprot:362682-Chlamydomonas_euryale.AAC.2
MCLRDAVANELPVHKEPSKAKLGRGWLVRNGSRPVTYALRRLCRSVCTSAAKGSADGFDR